MQGINRKIAQVPRHMSENRLPALPLRLIKSYGTILETVDWNLNEKEWVKRYRLKKE